MIVGFTERLENTLFEYRDSEKKTDWADVMTAVVNMWLRRIFGRFLWIVWKKA